MRLWLQRHARVQCEPGLCYGRTDVAADPDATAAAASALAQRLPPGVQVWTSPLSRCVDLAQALQQRRADLSPAKKDDRLVEMDFGAWEGRPWADVSRWEFDQWTAHFDVARAGGHGDSTALFLARVQGAWEEARHGQADLLWITHAGVMRAVKLLASGIHTVQQAVDWPNAAIAYGECQLYEFPPAAAR